MKAHNNNQLYKSPSGDQQHCVWNSGRQYWILSHIGDQEGTISDPSILFGIVSSRRVRPVSRKEGPS